MYGGARRVLALVKFRFSRLARSGIHTFPARRKLAPETWAECTDSLCFLVSVRNLTLAKGNWPGHLRRPVSPLDTFLRLSRNLTSSCPGSYRQPSIGLYRSEKESPCILCSPDCRREQVPHHPPISRDRAMQASKGMVSGGHVKTGMPGPLLPGRASIFTG